MIGIFLPVRLHAFLENDGVRVEIMIEIDLTESYYYLGFSLQ